MPTSRTAAGLHAPAPARSEHRVVGVARRLAGDPQLRRLAPIWWLVCAYIAVAAIALLVGAKWSLSYAVIPRLGSGALGLGAIAAAAVASIWLGLRGHSRWVVELALLVAAVPVVAHLAHRPTPPTTYEPGTNRVAHPDASPPVKIPRLATPPLRRR